jgi:hypothetical protein
MRAQLRVRPLLGLAGLLTLAAAWLLQDPGRVGELPYISEFKPFPALLGSMVASAQWGLAAVGLFLLAASFYWNRILQALRGSEEAPDRRGRTVSWSLFLVSLLLYLLIQRLAFLDYPLTPDEFAYLYQAKILARGQWTVPAHPLQEFFKCAFVAEHEGRLFSIMPVGWSLLLVPWVLLGIPWVLSPLCTALAVVLTYQVGRSIYGHRAGMLAALLTAASPFVVFHAGTYLSHQASLLAFMAFLSLFIRLERGEQATRPYVLLGCVTAAIPLIHHIEPSMLLPFLLLFALRFLKGTVYPRRKLLLSGILSLALFLSVTGWQNHVLTGSPTKVLFQVYMDDDNFMSKEFAVKPVLGIHDWFTLKQRVVWWVKRLLSLNYCLFPLAPLLMLLPAVLRGRGRWDFLLLGAFLCLSAGYMFYNTYGGLQFGPRYYFPAAGVAYLLVAEAFLRLHARAGAPLRGGITFLIVLAFLYQLGLSAMIVRFVPDTVRRMRIIQNAGAHLAEQGLHNSVLLLAPSASDPKVTPISIHLRIRNGLDFEDDNLAALDRGSENGRLMDFYPDRRFFHYRISMLDLVKGNTMSMEELRRADFP